MHSRAFVAARWLALRFLSRTPSVPALTRCPVDQSRVETVHREQIRGKPEPFSDCSLWG
jgi:hypothetical protein